ncbi:Kri1-C domain-containing protein [Mycena kentingensis (nom. inval.)]|nr:Kri1-C domain-containing protein [Mycena kentingensis (nom. inval.)]
MLSDSESDSERDLHQLTINDHYAKAFEYRKEREELQKLKDQYGSDPDSEEEDETDSESAESEDSDGEELTPAMDAAILHVVDLFGSSYNFRFEEERRNQKDARERRKQRKQEEMAARKEDAKRLKGLKMKDLRGRLEREGMAAGEAESLRYLGIDLDADWDPDAHDICTRSTGTRTTPTRASWRRLTTRRNQLGMTISTLAISTMGDDEEWDGTEEMRKRKLKQWVDEIYALDFNDIVGGQSTRASTTPRSRHKTMPSPALTADTVNDQSSCASF